MINCYLIIDDKGEDYATDCYGAFAIYTLYLPSLVSAPFIVMADFRVSRLYLSSNTGSNIYLFRTFTT